MGKFFDIDAEQTVLDNLGTSRIEVSYLDSEVSAAGIDESTLRLYFWNGATWQVADGGVDTTNNFVFANTNHFSTWGIFGNILSTSSEEDEKDKNEGSYFGGVIGGTTTPTNANGEPINLVGGNPEDNGFFSTITGAVIGVLGTGGTIFAIVFVVAILGSVVVFGIRRRKTE